MIILDKCVKKTVVKLNQYLTKKGKKWIVLCYT